MFCFVDSFMRFLLIIIFSSLLLSSFDKTSCIVSKDNREVYRNQYTYPETIQSENFVIHFTTSDIDSQYVNGQWFNLQSNTTYAQSIIDHLESALVKYLDDGWENIPPDCDESISDIESPNHCINFGGNALYDIYIANDAAGMVVPENPYPVAPYTGGYTSYMKISTLSNQYDALPSWNYHVAAHELHHSIQLRYGYSVSGEPGNYMYNGWLFEQTATYMENVIYPNSFHLRTMLSNCNVVTPLTYPEYNIDYPAEIYPYRSALWQKFLVESLGDSSIVRYIWEDYGLQYAAGNPVSLFPIYSNAVETVSNNNLSGAYNDYAIWRYFTGDRSISNMHFNESSSYCTASTISDFENSFLISSNKGASSYINLPSDNMDLIIYTDFPNDINFTYLNITPNNQIHIESLSSQNNYNYFNISSEGTNVLIANSNYFDINSIDLEFTLSINSNLLGDINVDGSIDVLDVVNIVNLILINDYDFNGDLNNDQELNIIDIVQLINIILE